MNKGIVIAIDGYSSCGKSTLAKKLAEILNYIYIDTGAMYRAVTYYFMKNDLFVNNQLSEELIQDHLDKIDVTFEKQADETIRTFLNGQDVETKIRSLEVSNQVSAVSKFASIRKKMVALQQAMGAKKSVILDGRDIGTVVFPDAEVKLFLTAEPEIRAQRRYKEMTDDGVAVKFEDVLENINKRDYEDENRKESPLKKADDAVVIDNSNYSKKEQLQEALDIIMMNF
jgi:cytidylate kinase